MHRVPNDVKMHTTVTVWNHIAPLGAKEFTSRAPCSASGPPTLLPHCFSCRKFSPSMFLLSTCTGLIGLLFSVNPYLSTSWSTPLAFGFWWLSVVLFLICLTMVSLRWALRAG